MTVADDAIAAALREIEPMLSQPTKSAQESFDLEAGIRTVRKLLAEHGDRWISPADAQRYLLARSEDYVRGSARTGRLRSRTLLDGTLELSLDSVLNDREGYEMLIAIDNGVPITPEEAMYLLRPREYPKPPGYPESIRRRNQPE
jgi:hypothetical protein